MDFHQNGTGYASQRADLSDDTLVNRAQRRNLMKKLMMGLVTLGFVGLLSAPAEASVIRITISSTTCSVACPTQTIFGVGNAATFVGTFGDVSLSINAFSNNPGNTDSALLTQTDIAAKSLGSDAEQITVDISQQDFNLPI